MNNTSTTNQSDEQTSVDKLKNTEVSILSGAADDTPQVVKLIEFLPQIGRGTWRDQIEQIREVFAKSGKKACSGLKKKLTAIQFAGVFTGRGDGSLVSYSQLICIDIDEVEPHQIDDVFANLIQSPSLFCLFRSPTGGLKAVLHLGLEDPALHSTVGFNAAVREIGRLCPKVPVDKSASKNLERLCFVSWDPSWYVNWDAVPLTITAEDMQPKDPRRNGAPEPGAQDALYSVLKACGLSLDPDIDKTSTPGSWEGFCLFREQHENESKHTDMRIFLTGTPNIWCFHESCRAAREELTRRWREEIHRQENSVLLTFVGRIKHCTRGALLNHIVPEIKASRALSDDDREVLAHEISQCKFDLGGTIRIPTARELVAPKWTDAEIQERRKKQEKMDRARNQWTKGWYYSIADHGYVKEGEREVYDVTAFNVENTQFVPIGKSGRPENTASGFVIEKALIENVAGMMYEPRSDEPIVTFNGSRYLNIYLPSSRPTPAETMTDEAWQAMKKLERHILTMGNNDPKLMDWMAHQIQHPGRLLRFAPLISGPPGAGKNTLERILRAALGNLNVRTVSNDELRHKWTGFANEALVAVLSEIKIAHTSKHEVANRMKSLVTDETITIERKGSNPIQVENRTNYLGLTNHTSVMPADPGERRWWHIHVRSTIQQMFEAAGHATAQAYFDEIYDIIESRASEILTWLLRHKISRDFRKLRMAPMTEDKLFAMAETKDSLTGFVEAEGIINEGATPYVTYRVLAASALFEAIRNNYGIDIPETSYRKYLLKELGFVPCIACNHRMKIRGTDYRIYVHRDHAGLTKDQVQFILTSSERGI